MSGDIDYFYVRSRKLEDIHESTNTLRLLAKHLEIETDNEDPVDYLRFVIDNCLADVMEDSARRRLKKAEKMRLGGKP